MKKGTGIIIFIMSAFLAPNCAVAQGDEDLNVVESAEVSLESYSDAFQEQFFEGLKQKAIENYDRAINALLECTALEPDNAAVLHELAGLYYQTNAYEQSKQYATEALVLAPDNYWFLHTLITTLDKTGTTVESFEDILPLENPKFKENLAGIYFNQQQYAAAHALVKELPKTKSTLVLAQRISEALAKQPLERTGSLTKITSEQNGDINSLESYKTRIESLLLRPEAMSLVQEVAEEALERYPAQPYFYYASGAALNKNGKPKEAISVLEAALDYMISDIPLANKVYTELAAAYNAISNPSKANMYLSKIK